MAGVDHVSLGAMKTKINIERAYLRGVGVVRRSDDEWVEDRRSGRLQGPFQGQDAVLCAGRLNDFVARNAPEEIVRLDGAAPFVAVDLDGVIIR